MANNPFICMLVGAAGAGKSSFINTLIKYVNTTNGSSQKKLKSYVPTARSHAMGGHTMTREPVELTQDLIVVDNRGWHDWKNEAALKELAAQIHGKRSFDDDVNWDDKSQSSTKGDSSMTLVTTDKVDCTTLVLNGIGGIDAVVNITELIETCRKHTKRLPSVVITHKDEILDKQKESMIVFLENENIGREKIFVVKNITSKDEILDDETRSIIFNFIESCRDDGEAGAEAHIRRETLKQKMEKNRVEEVEKGILESQNELRKLEIIEATARTKSTTEHMKTMASLKQGALTQETEHDKKMQDMSEKLSEQKQKNEADMHEHEKRVREEFAKGLLKKIEQKL